MKKFKGNMSLVDIEFKIKSRGWKIDKSQYNAGSDWLMFQFYHADLPKGWVNVLYSPFKGKFMVRPEDCDRIITESNHKMDNVPWYAELLDFLYVSESEAV